MSRLWQPRETRLLSEWVAENFPEDRVMYRVRLGEYPEWAKTAIAKGAPREIYKIYQRWADAIVLREKELIIIEAKIRPDPGVISQIKLYEQLLPKTEAFADFRDYPIRLIVLMAMRDLEVEEMAEGLGIEVHIYTPPWVIAYLKEIKKYRERY